MEGALAASDNTLPATEGFTQAIEALPPGDRNYLYASWPALKAALRPTFPAISAIEAIARPLLSDIETLAATQQDDGTTSLLVQVAQ